MITLAGRLRSVFVRMALLVSVDWFVECLLGGQRRGAPRNIAPCRALNPTGVIIRGHANISMYLVSSTLDIDSINVPPQRE